MGRQATRSAGPSNWSSCPWFPLCRYRKVWKRKMHRMPSVSTGTPQRRSSASFANCEDAGTDCRSAHRRSRLLRTARSSTERLISIWCSPSKRPTPHTRKANFPARRHSSRRINLPPAVPAGAPRRTRHAQHRARVGSEYGEGFGELPGFRDGQKIAANLTAPAYSDRDVKQGVKYQYQVSALDNAGNESAKSPVAEGVIPSRKRGYTGVK